MIRGALIVQARRFKVAAEDGGPDAVVAVQLQPPGLDVKARIVTLRSVDTTLYCSTWQEVIARNALARDQGRLTVVVFVAVCIF